ncbi:DsbC family protein [Cupriavidus pauculus]|uniref:Thiol:disulfide interchange protein n=2 Tax=Cupriavidus TaxID=106589 RepID=A0A5P2H637_9BURK|nr:DsbC family protein [Cupriavidus pauculus]
MLQMFRRKSLRATAAVTLVGGLAAAGYALHALAADEPSTASIKATIEKMVGGRAEVRSVTKTPVPGLYEVSLGSQVVYTDATGRYILNGELIDTKTSTNLTEERVAELNRIKWSDLPLSRAVKWSKGDGSRTIAVFSDPNCPYCKRIEQTFQQMDNITVYTFLYPVLSPDSTQKSKQIWCASDRSKAWRDWMLNHVAVTGKSDCKNPIDDNLKLGQSMNVTGTPAVFFTDGSRIPGAADVATLERKFASLKK